MKPVSAGVLIFNENKTKLLLCHVTGQNFFDIPKGMQNKDEMPITTAVRETQEETGLVLNPENLIDNGYHSFNKRKNIHIFETQISEADNKPETLQCTSFFKHHKTGQEIPEMDGFQWFDIKDVFESISPSMKKLFINNKPKWFKNLN